MKKRTSPAARLRRLTSKKRPTRGLPRSQDALAAGRGHVIARSFGKEAANPHKRAPAPASASVADASTLERLRVEMNAASAKEPSRQC